MTILQSFFEDERDKFVEKIDNSLAFAVVTGCLKTSRENIFTGLNNLRIVSILNDNCAECFGFTPKEVGKILHDYELESQARQVRKWYDGYLFGETEVYNPCKGANREDGICFHRKDCLVKIAEK